MRYAFAGEGAAGAKATATPAADDDAAVLRKLQERGPRDIAIEKAVAFLIAGQNKDGSFGDKHKNALTGLSVMALMAAGHTPDNPPHGPAIRNALNYILSQMRSDGYLGHSDNSHMYGHGICTLMLTEAAGMTRDEMLEKRLVEGCRRAVDLILKAQAIKKAPHHQGGWRYEPGSGDSDLSLTGWQTMSLRSAKNIGIEVPNSAIQAAINYIRAMARNGEFSYEGGDGQPSLRGVGLLAMPVCGVYDAPELVKATAKMLKDPPKWQGPWFYYRTYYASVGMYQMGDDAWKRFYPVLDDVLLKNQKADGSWPEPPGNNEWDAGGPVYSTSMAMLALAVHYHLLPIYQR
ncbi:MAG: terpene cyclase/mutase family protein [Planctomycetota bacterium]|nr:terpene cyclase/mutase family protein [Planctomycetota bacterium]